MVWLHRFLGCLFICFSLLILTASISLGVGTPGDPGPGFVAFLAAALLGVLSLVVFVQGEMARGSGKRSTRVLGAFKKPAVLVVGLAGYTLLLNSLGYVGAMFLLMFVLLAMGSPRKWYLHLVGAAFIACTSFYVFHSWLKVQLPRGLLSIL